MIQAEKFTQEKGEEKLKCIIKKIYEEQGEISSDEDDYKYKAESSVNDGEMKKISKEKKIKLERCKQCYVVRTNRVHHCAVCKGCILNMDHHCPWINNCVGQFNKKYFYLLIFYSSIGSMHAIFICVYYSIYKNFDETFSNVLSIIRVIVHILISLLFGIFGISMIYEQKSSLPDETTYIDYKMGKVLEKRSIKESIVEIFGEDFNIGWFLPFKCGGYKAEFNKKVKII